MSVGRIGSPGRIERFGVLPTRSTWLIDEILGQPVAVYGDRVDVAAGDRLARRHRMAQHRQLDHPVDPAGDAQALGVGGGADIGDDAAAAGVVGEIVDRDRWSARRPARRGGARDCRDRAARGRRAAGRRARASARRRPPRRRSPRSRARPSPGRSASAAARRASARAPWRRARRHRRSPCRPARGRGRRWRWRRGRHRRTDRRGGSTEAFTTMSPRSSGWASCGRRQGEHAGDQEREAGGPGHGVGLSDGDRHVGHQRKLLSVLDIWSETVITFEFIS